MTKHWLNMTVSSVDLDKAICELSNCLFLYFQTSSVQKFCQWKHLLLLGAKASKPQNYRLFLKLWQWLIFIILHSLHPKNWLQFIYTEQSFLTRFSLVQTDAKFDLVRTPLSRWKTHSGGFNSFLSPNKLRLLTRQIKELTSAAFCHREMTRYFSRATSSDTELRTLESVSTKSLAFWLENNLEISWWFLSMGVRPPPESPWTWR